MKEKMQGVKLLVLNYAVFITLIVTIELLGQFGYWILRGRFLYETSPDIVFEEHPYLSGMPKKNFQYINSEGKTVTTDENGFRITRKNDYEKDAVNIICLGGSTTFGTWTTDQDSWPYKLQTKLGAGYNVFNLGVPGYTTLEGMIQLITLVPELDPDIVIIYEGWNDIRNYHIEPKSPDYYWHGMSQKINLEFGGRILFDNFFIGKFSRKLGRMLTPTTAFEDTEGVACNDAYVDSLYRRNLRTMKSLCNNLKAKMIFIPQVLNIDSLKNAPGIYAWTPNIQNKNMPMMMRKFNSLMQEEIQKDSNIIVIENIQSKYQWNRQHFADFGHFNEVGGDFFSNVVLVAIRDLEEREFSSSKSD
jgi:lysophospholipase L1-like esterase